ncbi:dTDP-4-dehydrorhamnose reductase [Gracilaria domingensis]|nr:dTDP-4-dehydrorhamnose reductase [Gracilaria domingensis]
MTGTLVIIGATGELGGKTILAACADDATGWPGDIVATYNNSPPVLGLSRVTWVKLDCSDHKAVRSLVVSLSELAAVVYCAVPKHGGAAGKGGALVRAGVVDDVVNCAEAVALIDAKFVMVSTDLVFDGSIPEGESYDEASKTCPPNPYGVYKQQMEQQLLALSGKIVVARTSLILTMDEPPYGKGIQFVVDCINGKKGEIELFTDEWRNMSFSDDLGRALVELAKPQCTHVGLIHMVSDEVTNRWELAKLLAKRLGLEDKLGKFAKSGLSAESGLNRPLNCALSTKLKNKVLTTHIDGISERLSK